jgi:NAD(P)-dependent dehydrogenase (short-subunit alcohol dehydrogenase family)
MQLAGKRAVVTGAATGIGRAVALRLAGEGAAIAIADINVDGAHEARRAIEAGGGVAHAIPTDVADPHAVRNLMDTAAARLGGIDVVVNNAGIVRCGAVADYDERDWDLTLNVNAKSVFLGVKYALPHLRWAGGGSIVNTASIAALRGGPGTTAYAASKGAVVSMTRQLANELAPEGIRVNCICPGWIDTPFNQPAIDYLGGDAALDALLTQIPLKRMGSPDEAASVFLFLASDASSFMTGQALVVDGGLV